MNKYKYLLVPAKEVQQYLDKGWNLYGSPIVLSNMAWQAITKVE